MYPISRKATKKEVQVYEKVEELTKNMDDNSFNDMLDTISNYLWPSHKKEAKEKSHKAIQSIAESLGVTVEMLTIWYFCEEA